jgi:hypothetical protein
MQKHPRSSCLWPGVAERVVWESRTGAHCVAVSNFDARMHRAARPVRRSVAFGRRASGMEVKVEWPCLERSGSNGQPTRATEHHEGRPNLKHEDEGQDNAQLCGLAPLTWSRSKWRSGRIALQLTQRANPSIERTSNSWLRHLSVPPLMSNVRPRETMALDIPGHEHYVSAHELKDDQLFLRLTSDYYAGEECGSFELSATGVAQPDQVLAYLNRAKEGNQYLYALARDGGVVLADEDGDEITIQAATIEVRQDVWNRSESAYALTQARDQYEREYESGHRASGKIQRVRELVEEQLRRIEVKAGSHEESSSAGILYAQHTQFLVRLLRETEA